MSEFYDDLIQESAKIKKNYRKTKYMNKLFIRFIIAVIYTCIMCYIFSMLNEVFNFYNSFALAILAMVGLFAAFNNTILQINKKRKLGSFMIYMTAVSLYLIPNCDLSNLKVIIFKIIIALVIYFIIMITSKSALKVQVIANIFIIISVFSLSVLNIIDIVCAGGIILNIVIASYVFKKISCFTKDSNETLEWLNQKLYGYLICIHALFMFMCALII